MPDAVEIAVTGATFAGVATWRPPQRQQKLQVGSQIKRIELKLLRGNGGGEQRMKLQCHGPIKKTGPMGPASLLA